MIVDFCKRDPRKKRATRRGERVARGFNGLACQEGAWRGSPGLCSGSTGAPGSLWVWGRGNPGNHPGTAPRTGIRNRAVGGNSQFLHEHLAYASFVGQVAWSKATGVPIRGAAAAAWSQSVARKLFGLDCEKHARI